MPEVYDSGVNMETRTIRKRVHAEPMSSGKRRPLDNFRTAVGMEANWVDMNTGIMYMIQEYAEKLHDPRIPKDKKPTKIRTTNVHTGEDLGYVDEMLVEIRMRDPEPDPRY